MQPVYAYSLVAFFTVTFVIALWARYKVSNAEDFIVAGRSLATPLLVGTLIATWFGAGTLSVSADAVFDEGLVISGLEPFGVGFCLILAGMVYTRRVWEQKVLTLADIFRRHYGRTAELLQVVYSISYFGWIAVQLIAIGHIIELSFGLDVATSIILVTFLLAIYTMLGGMWSVAITDVVQVCLLIAGLFVLTANVFDVLGQGSMVHGIERIFSESDPDMLVWIPTDTLDKFNYWLGLFIVGALGNLATQDVMQRIFAAKTARVATQACIYSGIIYIVVALMPVMLGLAGKLLLPPEVTNSIITAMARQFMSPAMSVVFMLTLTAAITSTVDSALLGPASTFSQNLLRHWVKGKVSTLTLTRMAVAGVAIASASLALSGARAIDLLQSSYTLGIPPLVVLTFALYQKDTYSLSAIMTFLLGLLVWAYDMMLLLNPENFPNGNILSIYLPLPLVMLLLSTGTYLLCHYGMRWRQNVEPYRVRTQTK